MDKKFDIWDTDKLEEKAIEAEKFGKDTIAALFVIAHALRCISFDLVEIREQIFPDCVDKEIGKKDN